MKPSDEGKEQDRQNNNSEKQQRIPSLAESQHQLTQELTHKEHPAHPEAAPAKPKQAIKRVIPLSEADAVQEGLYARREKVYPREVHGTFANWRVVMASITLGIYYLLPWINWGAGRQAFLIDLPGRKFHLFAWTFWPQDLFYLTAILIISALSLFLFTAVAGRLWCGFTCPQTVWTEVFLWVERKIEGNRMQQMKLAASPWSRDKLVKKGTKHMVWLLFSAWTGFIFVGYFTPVRELSVSLLQVSLGPWETFWIAFYGFATYGNAGWLREQVCTYMCPYARFQSVMFDRDTLIISYDTKRGEQRGPRARKTDYKQQGLGDCINCTLCVQVCPTGIDIRDGLQIECISCAACVDVCDSVMGKMGYPKGLIRYTTQNALEGGPSRLLRPRVIVYTLILAAIASALLFNVLMRVPLGLDVIRDRNALYRETIGGMIENVYILKIVNMDSSEHSYQLSATGIDNLKLYTDLREIRVAAGEVREVPARLRVHPADLHQRSTKVSFVLQADENPRLKVREEARFLGPGG